MFVKSGESRKSYFVPDFVGNDVNFSSLNIMLNMGLLYISFITLRYVLFSHSFFRTPYQEEVLDFVKVFSEYIKMTMVFLSLVQFIAFVDLYVELLIHLYNRANFIRTINTDLLGVFLNLIYIYLIKYLHLYSL